MRTINFKPAKKIITLLSILACIFFNASAQPFTNSIDINTTLHNVGNVNDYNTWLVTNESPAMAAVTTINTTAMPSSNTVPVANTNYTVIPYSPATGVVPTAPALEPFNPHEGKLSCYSNNVLYSNWFAGGQNTTGYTMIISRRFKVCATGTTSIHFALNVVCDDGLLWVRVDNNPALSLLNTMTPGLNPGGITITGDLPLSPGIHTLDFNCFDLEDVNGVPITINGGAMLQWNPFFFSATGNITAASAILINGIDPASNPTNSSPTPGAHNVCVGDQIHLVNNTAGGPGTWTSSDPSIATVNASTGWVTGVSVGSTNITYTITHGDCIASTDYAINVIAGTPITGPNHVCEGSTITLSNSTPNGTWSTTGGPYGATITQTGVFTGIEQGVYTVSYQYTHMICPITFIVTVDPGISPITGNNHVCVGGTTPLSAYPVGGTWSSSNTSIATIASTGVVTGVAAGTSTISYFVNGGQCGTSTFTITVDPGLPAIAGPSAVCPGFTITLSNTIPGGTWSSSNTSVATISSTGVVTGVATGTTTITYTIAGSACPPKTKVITVNPPISPITGSSHTVCFGQTLQLADASPGGTWSSSNTSIATVSSTGLVTGIIIGNVTISYSVSGLCNSPATYAVSVTDCHCEDPCSWSLTGNQNVVPGNWIGSRNNADFNIKTFSTQRMIVTAAGKVGINTTTPSTLFEVNGEATVKTLNDAASGDKLIFADGNGTLKKLLPGFSNQYLSGNGTWQDLPTGGGTGLTGAQNGLTVAGDIVNLGDDCHKPGGEFKSNRQVNMNNYNLFFHSVMGKLYMGNADRVDDCDKLQARLELETKDLTVENSYATDLASPSGLRFTNLTANSFAIPNERAGVLSLDDQGDVIWVEKCCRDGKMETKLNELAERLTKLEDQFKNLQQENATLKSQLSNMDVFLSDNNTVVLNQNVPNPFAEKTTITYMIPINFHQAQIIFSTITGEVIRTAEIKQAGKGMVNVYASDISSGIYTYTLIIDGKKIDTKKMVKQ